MVDVTAGAAVTGGDNAGANNAAANNAGGEAAAFDWSKSGLDTDTLGYVQTKGFKDPAAVLGSYRNLEKLHGVPAEQLLKLPGADAKPEDWAGVYDKLGRPKTADMYDIPLPEGDTGEFAKIARDWFHESGLSVKQAKGVVEKWNAHVATTMKAQADATALAQTKAQSDLKAEWGDKFDANATLVDKAAEAFGMKKPEFDALKQAMGPAGAMKFLHNIAVKMGVDDTITTGGGKPAGFGRMSPEQAQAQILAKRNDLAFGKRFASGDADARREMNELHAAAYPGDTILGR